MKMILCFARCEQWDVFGAGKSTHVGPQSLWVADQIGAIFCAKDTMKVIANIGVGHSPTVLIWGNLRCDAEHTTLSSLRDLGGMVGCSRRWKRRAKLFWPSGPTEHTYGREVSRTS